MLPQPPKVILDANVLFPFALRDTLLRAAEQGLYQIFWSTQILDEVRRNLISKGVTSDAQVDRLFEQMNRAFPEALVTGFEPLIPTMPNDPKDRHVTAAALISGGGTIITNNLKDFRLLPPNLSAISPDDFLCELLQTRPSDLIQLLAVQASSYKNPPRRLEDLLQGLAKMVPKFVVAVRGHGEKMASNRATEESP